MAQVPNIKRIRREDFDSEYQELIDKLAYSLNTFMDDTINLLDGNIDFQNLTQTIKTINVKIGATAGIPENDFKINTELGRKIEGIVCIKATRIDNPSVVPDSAPFVTFTILSTDIIKVTNISGLQANSEYQLKLLLIS